ncbi:MAG: hypothetical protein QW196_07090 [Sulfolobales archaeon]
MSRGSWKESLYKVYKALEDQAKKGEKEVSLLKLSALTGFSPLYLKVHMLPMLAEILQCIQYVRGRVVFECVEDDSKS